MYIFTVHDTHIYIVHEVRQRQGGCYCQISFAFGTAGTLVCHPSIWKAYSLGRTNIKGRQNVHHGFWHNMIAYTLQWRHNERDGVLNHQPRNCLLNGIYSGSDPRKHQTSRHWPVWWEFTCDRWIPRTKGQLRWTCFHLMTSSWIYKSWHYIHPHQYIKITFLGDSQCIQCTSHGKKTPWFDGYIIPLKGEHIYESSSISDWKITQWISITILCNWTRSILESGIASTKLPDFSVDDNDTNTIQMTLLSRGSFSISDHGQSLI